MKWMLSWRENGRLEVKVVTLREAQRLEDELRAREIFATVKRVRPRGQ
jgi:hypothetical protein